MGLVYTGLELFVAAMQLPLVVLLAISFAWAPLVVLEHELAHGLVARKLTRGPVRIEVGRAPFIARFSLLGCRIALALSASTAGGTTTYDSRRLWRGRHEAYIALAGPAGSFGLAAFLFGSAMMVATSSTGAAHVLVLGAASAALAGVLTLTPMRYAVGSGSAGLDSDGRVAWRVLTGGTGRQPSFVYGRDDPSSPFVRPAFLVVLVGTALAAFAIGPFLGVVLLALFAVAAWLQAADERHDR